MKMLRLNKLLAKVPSLSKHISSTSYLHHSELVVHRDSPENNSKTPFEFTEANMTRICALIQNYPAGAQRSALGACLDIVQRQIGWVPISAMHKIAELLSIPRIRVYEYATFYTMVKREVTSRGLQKLSRQVPARRWRGKYHVKVCSTTPCMLRGSELILRAAEDICCCSAGSVSPDGMFGVDIVECAGACANAPVLVIDDDYYEDVTECDVFNIIQQIRVGCIPQPGPQNGRYAAEPVTGPTTLLCPPPPPGFCLQTALRCDNKCK